MTTRRPGGVRHADLGDARSAGSRGSGNRHRGVERHAQPRHRGCTPCAVHRSCGVTRCTPTEAERAQTLAVRDCGGRGGGVVPVAPVAKRSTRFGFTLLEVMLAIAVLVAVASLGSALWTQAGDASLGAQQRERVGAADWDIPARPVVAASGCSTRSRTMRTEPACRGLCSRRLASRSRRRRRCCSAMRAR